MKNMHIIGIALLSNLSCSNHTHGEESRLSDCAASYVGSSLELYYWNHGKLPETYDVIKPTVMRVKKVGGPKVNDIFSWEISTPRGGEYNNPYYTEVMMTAENSDSKIIAMKIPVDLSLSTKGKDWDVKKDFNEKGEFSPLKDDVNYAACYADARYHYQKNLKTWPTKEFLLTGQNIGLLK